MEPYISSFPRIKTNDLILRDIGAFISEGFSCTPSINTEVWSGVGRNSFHVANQAVGLQTIILPMVFEARCIERGRLDLNQWPAFKYDEQSRISGKLLLDEYPSAKGFTRTRRAEIELNIGKFEKKLLGKFTLNIGDGFEYQCVLTNIGSPVWHGEYFCEKTYTLTAIKSYPLCTIKIPSYEDIIICNSNVPKTDCKITIDYDFTVPSALPQLASIFYLMSKELTLRDLVFNAPYGNNARFPLVFDGINKQITAGGQNFVSKFEWSDFPYLIPGENAISYRFGEEDFEDAEVTVEYYPTFM